MHSVEVAADSEATLDENVGAEIVATAPTENPHIDIATKEAVVEPQQDESSANSGDIEKVPVEANEKVQPTEEVKAAEGSLAPLSIDQARAVELAQDANGVEKEGDKAKNDEAAAVEENPTMATDANERSDGNVAVEMKDASLQHVEGHGIEGKAVFDEATIPVTIESTNAEGRVDTCSQSNKLENVQVDGNAERRKAANLASDVPDQAAAADGNMCEKTAGDVDVGNRPSACDAAPEAEEAGAMEQVQPASEETNKSVEAELAAAMDGRVAMEVDAVEKRVRAKDVNSAGPESTPVKGISEMETDTPEKARQIISEPQTKRPLTPIFQFINDNRARIQRDFNVRKTPDVAKIAKGLFDALSDEERQFYEDQYEERKRAFEAFMATEQGEEHAKEQAKKGGSSRSNRQAAPKPNTKKPKAKAKAAPSKKASKVLRPTPPVTQYMRENRYRIMAEHGVKRAIDLPKKAKELFDQLPEEQKKIFQDRYEQQKVAWTQFKASEKIAIKQYKTQLGKQKEQEESKKKASLGSAFKAGAKPQHARATTKRSRKAAGSSVPSRSAKQAKVTEVPVVLSPAGMERAKKMGVAPSGIPYIRLLEKLLATPQMEKIAEDEALDSLKKSKGNVNLARNAIKSRVIEL